MATGQDTELMLDVGQANEIKLAARRGGYTNADLKRLSEGDVMARILPVIRGHAEIKMCEHLINCDAGPFIPNGWSVLPDNEQLRNRVRGSLKWDLAKTKLHLDKGQEGSKVLVGYALCEALKAERVLPANALDYFLAHPELIPEEWKDKAVFFWGTIYRDSDGDLYVRYLCWDGEQWDWGYDWLDGGWRDRGPALVLAS